MDPSTPPHIREWDVLVTYRLNFSYFYFPFLQYALQNVVPSRLFDGWILMVLRVLTWTLDGRGQLQAPAKFIRGKYLQIPTEYGDGSAADMFSTFLRGEKLFAPIGIRTQIVHHVP